MRAINQIQGFSDQLMIKILKLIFCSQKLDSRRQDASVQTSSTSMSGIPPVRRASLTELSPRARWWRWWWRSWRWQWWWWWLLFWWKNCDERQKTFSYIGQLFDQWPTMNGPVLQAEPKENNFKHLSIFALVQLKLPKEVRIIIITTTMTIWRHQCQDWK